MSSLSSPSEQSELNTDKLSIDELIMLTEGNPIEYIITKSQLTPVIRKSLLTHNIIFGEEFTTDDLEIVITSIKWMSKRLYKIIVKDKELIRALCKWFKSQKIYYSWNNDEKEEILVSDALVTCHGDPEWRFIQKAF